MGQAGQVVLVLREELLAQLPPDLAGPLVLPARGPVLLHPISNAALRIDPPRLDILERALAAPAVTPRPGQVQKRGHAALVDARARALPLLRLRRVGSCCAALGGSGGGSRSSRIVEIEEVPFLLPVAKVLLDVFLSAAAALEGQQLRRWQVGAPEALRRRSGNGTVAARPGQRERLRREARERCGAAGDAKARR